MAPYCEDAPDYVNVFLNCERCDLHGTLLSLLSHAPTTLVLRWLLTPLVQCSDADDPGLRGPPHVRRLRVALPPLPRLVVGPTPAGPGSLSWPFPTH